MAPEAVAAEAVSPEAVAPEALAPEALAPDVMSVVQSQPGVPKPDPILTADRLVRSFGAFKAVDIETIEIQRGVITALIGPNGAGKTTFFNLATGFDDTDEGSCWFQNRRITGMNNYQIARLGAVRTFQNTRALTRLTVMENMLFASQRQFGERLRRVYGTRWRHREWSEKERAEELLERFALAHMADEFAGTLSGGQRKLLEMARALMAEPTMVLLDEPLAGVNPALGETILEHILTLKESGTTVLFIEHDMSAVRKVSDWVVCMAEGRVIAEGTHAEVGQNQLVLDAYLGSTQGDMAAQGDMQDGKQGGSNHE